MKDLNFKNKALSLRNNIKKRNQQNLMRSQQKSYDASLSSLIVKGGTPLRGEISISGAKNAALPLLFATLMSDETITLSNIPQLSDIFVTIDILQELGAQVLTNGNQVIINASQVSKNSISPELACSMRASVLMLGPILTRLGSARIITPGGCTIGKRPIDIHLKCLQKMGANIEYKDNYIFLSAPHGLTGTNITMEKFSVGSTANLIMAATLAKGVTTITDPAKEPEILDLVHMLRSMGAIISGEGTNLITIEGVKALKGTTYTVCPDRIEAGSYLIAAAITKGSLTLRNVNHHDIQNVLVELHDIGCHIHTHNNMVEIKASHSLRCKDITTNPFPGFPTDLQPQWTSLMCLSKGNCIIKETIFENRLGHIKELKKMGANIDLLDDHHTFRVHGVTKLKGATLFPTDLRSSFGLILAALATNDISTIYNLSYLDRGYENPVDKLKACGANVTRIDNLHSNLNTNQTANIKSTTS